VSAHIETERLVLKPWMQGDADQALSIYGSPLVSRWLTPDLRSLRTPDDMRTVLRRWGDVDDQSVAGHWAAHSRSDGAVIGGLSLQYAPPGGESVSIAWQLAPTAWGQGYAAEAGAALIRWAMHERGLVEVFAVVQPDNERAAATAERIGMEWITELGHLAQGKYQVYRIRHGDLDYHE
jgi:[ribosomal protein S5]-alanine N-acetyltransferase